MIRLLVLIARGEETSVGLITKMKAQWETEPFWEEQRSSLSEGDRTWFSKFYIPKGN